MQLLAVCSIPTALGQYGNDEACTVVLGGARVLRVVKKHRDYTLTIETDAGHRRVPDHTMVEVLTTEV